MSDNKEGNRLIAEFMGESLNLEAKYGANWKRIIEHAGNMQDGEIRYHSSWDWLMPVVEKINKLGFQTSMLSVPMKTESGMFIAHGFKIKFFDDLGIDYHESLIPDNPIQAVWIACVSFIQWYNNQ